MKITTAQENLARLSKMRIDERQIEIALPMPKGCAEGCATRQLRQFLYCEFLRAPAHVHRSNDETHCRSCASFFPIVG
jgi:hypothetical protein